jgi:hypothetical protein
MRSSNSKRERPIYKKKLGITISDKQKIQLQYCGTFMGKIKNVEKEKTQITLQNPTKSH